MNAADSDTPANSTAATHEFVFTRTFDAPRDLVFKAWTEVDRLAQWWGPKGFKMLVSTLDLRPGGVFHYGMRAPNGQDMWGRFVYREIVAPDRLAFIVSFSDEQGGVTRHPWSPDWPLEVLSTMTFEEHSGKTTVIGRSTPFNATELEHKTFEAGYDSMQHGYSGTMDQLADYLAKATEGPSQ
ncbi:SRPBCC domain-containing protein [Pseudomonas cavernicola]|uniref:SRPBCC domain-containing protein n=1 Tax=Pseudomonas cavernicola TaxID=2320866 RepID=A0A418XDL0_9PSED|nr:SRPBCC domain-containing protein [Pseudomonas cavernicola]RJG10611.1 SRPBCC domain-containing protein [Pseudomonas cavernicola]